MSVQIRGGQIQNSSISSQQIADDAIDSDQIASNAIVAGKIATGAVTAAKIATGAIDAAAKLGSNVVTAAKIDLTGTFDYTSGVVSVATPSNSNHAANKSYVDGVVGGGVYWKEPARVATTANINLANPGSSIDGVTLASNDRVLVKDQTSAAQNGVYDFNGASSAMTRSADVDTADEINGMAIFVKQGSTNADQGYVQTAEVATLGTDSATYVQFTGLGQITAGNGLDKSGNELSVETGNGITISGGAVAVDAGGGLDFGGGTLDVQIDDSSIELNGSNQLAVKSLGISAGMIQSNAITSVKIANDAVGTTQIASGAVTATELGAAACTEVKIASGAVTESKIGAQAVTAAKIASAAVGDGLAGGAGTALSVNVDDASIEIDSSNGLQIKALGVATSMIQANAITAAKITNATITATQISATVAGDGLAGGAGTALSVDTGNGLTIAAGAVAVDAGGGLDFGGSTLDVQFDDASIEINGSNQLAVKNLGISSGMLQASAVTAAKLADDSVTAAKVGFQGYQELNTISNSSTSTINLSRQVDAAFLNGLMVYKNGLALLNQTALGGSASTNDDFTLSTVDSVTRITFGANLDSGDDVLAVYYT